MGIVVAIFVSAIINVAAMYAMTRIFLARLGVRLSAVIGREMEYCTKKLKEEIDDTLRRMILRHY